MVGAAGIVRPARRPAGWQPPGPPPAPARERVGLRPRAGEDLCFLAGDWRIFQPVRGHRWSLDDLVTAWFAAEQRRGREPRRIADLGCGLGSVLMLLAWRFPGAAAVGIEAEPARVALARRSLAWNGIGHRARVHHGDLREEVTVLERNRFDLVTATPPYLAPGTATASRDPEIAACHLERRGGIEEYVAAAARLLATGGVFVTCAGSTQTRRVMPAATANGLTLLRRRDVVPRAGKPPLFSVWAMAPAREGLAATVIESPLVVRDHEGRWTAEFRRVRSAMGMPA